MRKTRSVTSRQKTVDKNSFKCQEFVIELKSLRVPANMKLVTEMHTPPREEYDGQESDHQERFTDIVDVAPSPPKNDKQRYNLRARKNVRSTRKRK